MSEKNEAVQPRVEDKPLDRYFRILEVVSAYPSGIGLSQIAEIVYLPKTTVHRLLRGLLDSSVIETNPIAPQLFVTGARVRKLLYSSASADWIEAVTNIVLGEVAEQTGHTCYIAKLEDFKVRSVAMVTPNDPSSGYVVPGKHWRSMPHRQRRRSSLSRRPLCFAASSRIHFPALRTEPLSTWTRSWRS
jgi:IclR helix-turn-helix domain